MIPISAPKVHRSREWTRAPSSFARVIATKHGHGNKESGASSNQLVERVTSRFYLHQCSGRPHSLSIHTPLSPPPPTSRFPHYQDMAGIIHTLRICTRTLSYVARGTCQGRSSYWCASHSRGLLNRSAIFIDYRDALQSN